MANKEIEIFKEQYPSLNSYWRSIILFGRNVASYKFALAESLLEFVQTGKDVITLEELADPYSKRLCEHLKKAPKQTTSKSSQFIESCQKFNDGMISKDVLTDVTMLKGFNNVIDAFHVVNNQKISVEFYIKDYSANGKKLILTDNLFKLKELPFYENLYEEADSRWNLVETAWELNISRNLLNVKYDDADNVLFVDDHLKRKDITSARSALNGYQKGKCFYCFKNITVLEGTDDSCDVDHFFPYVLQKYMPDINLNGIWNLVLACHDCNRGAGGKFALVPSTKYIQRLHRRNEFLINSHHPLRDTIIKQTGKTEEERIKFLKNVDQRAIDILIHRWEIKEVAPATF